MVVIARPWHVPGKWYISPLTVDVAKLKPEQPARVHIHDSTLREGEETPKVVFTNKDRIEIVKKLDELGVEEIQMPLGMPPEERKELMDGIRRAHVRCELGQYASPHHLGADWKDGMKRLVGEGANRLLITCRYPALEGLPPLPGSPPNVEAGVEKISEMVGYAKTLGLPITFGAGGTTQRALEDVKAYSVAGVKAGADRVLLYDTFGVATPILARYLVREVKKAVGKAQIMWHGHNDLGMATANTLAAVEGGAEWLDVVMNGLGDRAGNCALEEVVTALEVACGVKTGIKLEKLYEVSLWFQEKSGLKLQPNKAVVGENAFLEEASSHYLMTARAQAAGFPEGAIGYAPQLVGQRHRLLVGSTTLYETAFNHLIAFWGFKASDEQVEEIRKRAMKEVQRRKYMQEEELREICESVLGKP